MHTSPTPSGKTVSRLKTLPLRRVALGLTALGAFAPAAHAGTTDYTSSTAFLSAAGPTNAETYGASTDGTDVPALTTLDGITYVSFTGPLEGRITSDFNSFSGLSLGALQPTGEHYFFGGNTVTITFPNPVTAAGVFFNVNANSGDFFLTTPDGTATTGSAAFDTSTFVFAGLISTTPFTTATFGSTDVNFGSFNIPELLYSSAPVTATPEPSSVAAFGFVALGAAGLILKARRRKAVA